MCVTQSVLPSAHPTWGQPESFNIKTLNCITNTLGLARKKKDLKYIPSVWLLGGLRGHLVVLFIKINCSASHKTLRFQKWEQLCVRGHQGHLPEAEVTSSCSPLHSHTFSREYGRIPSSKNLSCIAVNMLLNMTLKHKLQKQQLI